MSSKSFSKYLTEIGEIPLLTREREAELGRLVQIGGRGDATLMEQKASEEAQCELVRHNLKLAVSVATGFLGSSLTLEELTFEGNIGLLQAARRFNPVFKTRFSTYATWWIQQSIRQSVHRAHVVRMPVRRAMILRKIVNSRSFVEGALSQNLDAIANETGISKQKISDILTNRWAVVSLNTPQPNGDESLESVIDGGCKQPPETVIQSEEIRLAKMAVSELNPQEEHIVLARFGMDSAEIQTLKSFGKILWRQPRAHSTNREKGRQKHAVEAEASHETIGLGPDVFSSPPSQAQA